MTAWQARPLEPSYAIALFDALRVKIRDKGLVKNKAVNLAIGMDAAGFKHVLGPDRVVQSCIVHLIRYSMQFAFWKERNIIAVALKPIYHARDAEAAALRMQAFDERPWGQKYLAIDPELAAQLRGRAPVLGLLGGGAQDHLHH